LSFNQNKNNNNQGREKHNDDDDNNCDDATSSSSASSSSLYPIQVSWLDVQWGFYALPSNFKLSQSDCFRQGRVYGQDVTSGAAVAALLFSDDNNNSHHHDGDVSTPASGTSSDQYHGQQQQQQQQREEPLRILDLCCAPGLKLCAMADWLSKDDKQHNTRQITAATAHVSDQQHHQEEENSPLLDSPSSPVIVGVDISESRMSICKRVVDKYHIDTETCGQNDTTTTTTTTCHSRRARIRMYCTDGTTFGILKNKEDTMNRFSSSLVFDSEASLAQQKDDKICSSSFSSSGSVVGTKRKRLNKSARARLGKRLKQVAQLDCRQHEEGDDEKCNDKGERIAVKLFDRVLVDAECSTDGSLKHVQKRMQKELECKIATDKVDGFGSTNKASLAQSYFVRTLASKQHLDELVDLQRRLAVSGFRLLKPGGFMVYSTCSLCVEQNEEVVEWLLKEYEGQATLVPVNFGGSSLSQMTSCGLVKETKSGMITFLPNTSSDELCGGGFFLAKIQKKR
jgi:16S rRNA C967 or C1407 C5-methylase (RsmB/RsmF family)